MVGPVGSNLGAVAQDARHLGLQLAVQVHLQVDRLGWSPFLSPFRGWQGDVYPGASKGQGPLHTKPFGAGAVKQAVWGVGRDAVHQLVGVSGLIGSPAECLGGVVGNGYMVWVTVQAAGLEGQDHLGPVPADLPHQ